MYFVPKLQILSTFPIKLPNFRQFRHVCNLGLLVERHTRRFSTNSLVLCFFFISRHFFLCASCCCRSRSVGNGQSHETRLVGHFTCDERRRWPAAPRKSRTRLRSRFISACSCSCYPGAVYRRAYIPLFFSVCAPPCFVSFISRASEKRFKRAVVVRRVSKKRGRGRRR